MIFSYSENVAHCVLKEADQASDKFAKLSIIVRLISEVNIMVLWLMVAATFSAASSFSGAQREPQLAHLSQVRIFQYGNVGIGTGLFQSDLITLSLRDYQARLVIIFSNYHGTYSVSYSRVEKSDAGFRNQRICFSLVPGEFT